MSAISDGASGLGIDFCPPASSMPSRPAPPSSISSYQAAPARPHASLAACPPNRGVPSRQDSHSTLRSISAMQGLLLAEVGDAMVEFDITGAAGSSGFREGQRIAAEAVTPGGGSNLPKLQPTRYEMLAQVGTAERSLMRHGTLLTAGAPPGRKAAELKSILGNGNSRLKPGAAVLPGSATRIHPVALEQAKPRARVEVDIILESNTCVQGSYLRGSVKFRIRKRSKKESAVLVAGGKIRVIGFECIPNVDNRHTFYQCSSLLSAAAPASRDIYDSGRDDEGFAEVREGIHLLPFAMLLPLENEDGTPKGPLHVHSGVTVRYIAMVSIKVKDSGTGKRSIAHFYRDCEIWPRLDPSVVLTALPRPLQATISKGLFMGGSGKVTLTASLHRLHWIAGQQCYVKVSVSNDTKKAIKSLTLTLNRTTVVFKPHPHLDTEACSRERAADPDPDACQTLTTQKQVAETTLEMGQHGTRGHASAKGWWTGVSPGARMNFSHFILLPSDALSVARGRLLEVEYSIIASLGAGSLMLSDIQVTLPVRIINFLSVDPPPSSPLSHNVHEVDTSTLAATAAYLAAQAQYNPRLRPPIADGMFDSGSMRCLETLAESDDEEQPPSEEAHDRGDYDADLSYDSGTDDVCHDEPGDFLPDEECVTNAGNTSTSYPGEESNLGNSCLEDDDDLVQHAVSSADAGGALHFADLYYASVDENLGEQKQDAEPLATLGSSASALLAQGGQPPAPPAAAQPPTASRPKRPRGPSSFALRVQEKLDAAHGSAPSISAVKAATQMLENITNSPGPLTPDAASASASRGAFPLDSLAEGAEACADSDSATPVPGDGGVGARAVHGAGAAAVGAADSGAVHMPPRTGSRVLPRPPSLATIPLPPVSEPELPGPGDGSFSGVQMPQSVSMSGVGVAYDQAPGRVDFARPAPVRQMSSVQAKIRELEARARAGTL